MSLHGHDAIPLEEGGSAIGRSRHRYEPRVRAVMDLLCADLRRIASCLFQAYCRNSRDIGAPKELMGRNGGCPTEAASLFLIPSQFLAAQAPSEAVGLALTAIEDRHRKCRSAAAVAGMKIDGLRPLVASTGIQ